MIDNTYIINIIISSWTVLQCIAGYLAGVRSWLQSKKKYELNGSCVVVVPVYLPNEKDIVLDTIKHMSEQCVDRVHIVYNTPYAIPDIENKMNDLAETLNVSGKSVSVTHLKESTSKASNLNYAIEKSNETHIIIFDADHRPEPSCCRELRLHMNVKDAICVSGILGIRGNTFAAGILDAMEWLNWVILNQIIEQFVGSFHFGGSNAIWDSKVLKEFKFDEKVLLEDMDMTLRTLCHFKKKRIYCATNAISNELPPRDLRAFWKQRLRWAMGWEQLACRRIILVLKNRPRLFLLWFFRYAILISACAIFVQFIYQFTSTPKQVPFVQGSIVIFIPAHVTYIIQLLPITLYILLVILWSIKLHNRHRRVLFITLFILCSFVFFYFQAFLTIFAILCLCVQPKPKWVVTARATEVNKI